MTYRTPVAAALCFAAVTFATVSVLPGPAFATPKRVTDFADNGFSSGDIVSALKPNLNRGLTLGDGTSDAAPPAISLQLRFGRNSAELSADARHRLETVAAALTTAELAETHLIVSGHTDVTGSLEHNLALSQRRAESVKTYLVALGISAARLKAVGRGPTDLLDEEHPKSPVNRRVQFAVAS